MNVNDAESSIPGTNLPGTEKIFFTENKKMEFEAKIVDVLKNKA